MRPQNRKLNRLKDYDYTKDGYYYVTICTKDRMEWFGKIEDGKMILNECGIIVEQQWNWLENQYPYLRLDEYVIMPNHVHGIVTLVGNGRDRSLHHKIKPLSELIGAFKTTSSKMIHRINHQDFAWQKSFYDHIIRDESSLNKIREYIVNNPSQWDQDVENQKIWPASSRLAERQGRSVVAKKGSLACGQNTA